jgi:hypothetical protein
MWAGQAPHPLHTHPPIPDKRLNVKRIESSRNLSVNACYQQLASGVAVKGEHPWTLLNHSALISFG